MTSIHSSRSAPRSASRRRPPAEPLLRAATVGAVGGGPPSAASGLLPVALRDIEHTLGCRPYDSVAVRVVRKRRPFAVIRLDRPPGSDTAHAAAVGHTLIGLLGRIDQVQWIELVVYGPRAGRRRVLSPSVRATVDSVAAALEAAEYRLALRAVVVAGEATSLVGPAHSPWAPVPPPPESPTAASGADVHHGSFVPVVPIDESRRVRALAALAEVAPRRGSVRGAPPGSSSASVLDVLLDWRRALDGMPTPCSDALAIELAWSLRGEAVRDVVLLQCAWGLDAGVLAVQQRLVTTEPAAPDGARGAAAVAAAAGPAPARLDSSLASYWAVEREPRRASLVRAVELLRHIAACAPQSLAAPPLAMLAWLEWARGRGTVAADYVAAALAAEPGYRLAVLLRDSLRTGLRPGWERHV